MNKLLYLVLAVLCFACGDSKQDNPETTEVIKEAEKLKEVADFTDSPIPVLNYDQLEPMLTENNDTTYVVNFWATWCKPCIKEMPYFEEIGKNYAKEHVKVLFVSLDFPEKVTTQIVPFLEKNNIESDVVVLNDPDANGWIPKISAEWSGAIPATIIYKNNKRKFFERSFTYEELETELKTIL